MKGLNFAKDTAAYVHKLGLGLGFKVRVGVRVRVRVWR